MLERVSLLSVRIDPEGVSISKFAGNLTITNCRTWGENWSGKHVHVSTALRTLHGMEWPTVF